MENCVVINLLEFKSYIYCYTNSCCIYTVVNGCQANTQYVETEIEKLNGEQLVELKVLSHLDL